MGRHSTRAVVVGPIPVVAIVLKSLADELFPLPSRGGLAREQVEFDAGVGYVDRLGAFAQLGRIDPARGRGSRSGGRPPSHVVPSAEERGEYLVRLAVVLDHAPR